MRDEAFHKMTLMKAEYTGRVKRREDKIAQLEATLATHASAPAAASTTGSGLSSSAFDDKENDVSMSQSMEMVGNKAKAAGNGGKAADASKRFKVSHDKADGEQPQHQPVSAKRSTRSSAKALAPV